MTTQKSPPGFLANMEFQRVRYLEVNKRPPPHEVPWRPTFIPDPLEQRRTVLKALLAGVRVLAGRWRR